MPINIPVKQNERLEALLDRVQRDVELVQLWRCANVNAVSRLHMSDHGYVHAKVVANLGLQILRLLLEAKVVPSITKDHGMGHVDAEVVVVLASLLHDVGLAVHWDNHELYSVYIANERIPKMLKGLYEGAELVVIASEVLHAIVAHAGNTRCLTLEAGVVKVANALDMSQGRSRIPFEAGSVNIHSVSAQAVDRVEIKKGESKPVNIEVTMNNSAGIFQLDHLLKHKLKASGLGPRIEVTARVEGETDKRLIQLYNFNLD